MTRQVFPPIFRDYDKKLKDVRELMMHKEEPYSQTYSTNSRNSLVKVDSSESVAIPGWDGEV